MVKFTKKLINFKGDAWLNGIPVDLPLKITKKDCLGRFVTPSTSVTHKHLFHCSLCCLNPSRIVVKVVHAMFEIKRFLLAVDY